MSLVDDRQPSLPFARSSETSRDAARAVRSAAEQNRGRVLEAIRAAGANGMTCDEVQVLLGLSHQQCSPRVSELARSGEIVPSGLTRPTRSGPRFKAVAYRVRP